LRLTEIFRAEIFSRVPMYFHNTGYGRELSASLGVPWVNASVAALGDESSCNSYTSRSHIASFCLPLSLRWVKYAALLSHSTVYAYVVHIHNEDDNLSASLISDRTSEQSSFHFIEPQQSSFSIFIDTEVSLFFSFFSFSFIFFFCVGWVTDL
jgi:hypothetical protein